MVSGHAPALAKKLRYYDDANFSGRVLAPPTLAAGGYADRPAQQPDDWSDQPVLAVSAPSLAGAAGFEDDGGPRRQPELDAPEAPAPAPEIDELAHLDDGDDLETDAAFERFRPDRRLQATARIAALDPDDGLAL